MTYEWTDWLGERRTRCDLLKVASREALEVALRNTPNLNARRFRAIASGHSTSAVGQPVAGEIAVELDRKRWSAETQGADWWKVSRFPDGSRPFWAPACQSIDQLNADLVAKKLAMLNLGSYDGQSIYGAIATGTHGSGMISGPLADFVLSIDLTTVLVEHGVPVVRSFRIEPTDGITKRSAFEDDVDDVELLQEDEAFYAAVVSLGMFGIVTGLTLRVYPWFWLKEDRVVRPWTALRDEAEAQPTRSPAEHPRADLVLPPMPFKRHGHESGWWVQVTTRDVVPMPSDGKADARNDARTNAARTKFGMHGNEIIAAATALAETGSHAPRFANKCAFSNLATEADAPPWISRSDRVLRSSIGDFLGVTSTEVAVSKSDWIDATETVQRTLAALHNRKLHPLSPVGIRFQRASKHLLTQQFGRDTCTFEMPVLIGAHRNHPHPHNSRRDVDEILETMEKALVTAPISGRPHWGQRSAIGASERRRVHGAAVLARWTTQRKRFDPLGLFSNEMTKTLEL